VKWTIVALVIAAISGGAFPPLVSAQRGSNLIIAGQSIGQIHLGRYGAAYLAKLPVPDANDSGMGRYRSVWLSRKHGDHTDTLYIYSLANGPREIQPLNGVSIRFLNSKS